MVGVLHASVHMSESGKTQALEGCLQTSLGVQWLGLHLPCKVVHSVPSWGAQIPHASRQNTHTHTHTHTQQKQDGKNSKKTLKRWMSANTRKIKVKIESYKR